MKKTISLIPAILLAFSPLFGAMAVTQSGAMLDVNLSGSVNNTSTSSNGSSNTSGSVDSGVNAGASGSSNTNSESKNTNSQSSGSVGADFGTNVIFISRSDFSGDSEHSLSSVVSNALAVSTSAELRSYVRGLMEGDESLDTVVFSDSKVRVGHEVRGRLLGLFPVTFNADTTVDASGDVSIDYPWYSLLVTKNNAELESSIRARLEAQGFSQGSNRSTLSLSEQAKIAQSVMLAMKDAMENENNVDTSASGSVKSSSEASASSRN